MTAILEVEDLSVEFRTRSGIVRALDRVLREEPVMPKYVRAEVYNWLALLPGLRGPAKKLRKEFEQILERKVDRDLL